MNYLTNKIEIVLSVIVVGILIYTLAVFSRPYVSSAYTTPNILVGYDMTLGSTGPDVVLLQGLLSELGYLRVPINIPFGYYGPLTKDAVSRYQRDVGATPTAGYFGIRTKLAMHDQFSSRGWLNVLGW